MMIIADINCPIYVVHALHGYEQQENRIKRLFAEKNIDFEFVTDGDASALTEEKLNRYFVADVLSRFKIGGVSCTLNHILAYEKFIQSGSKLAIVFENDPCLLKGFDRNLLRIVEEAKLLTPGFIISLENTTLTFPSFFQVKRGRCLYRATCGRMAGAYIIDRAAALAALGDLKINPCSSIIDWWHNGLIDRNVVKMYWAHPPITEQGSHNGLMQGTISTRQKSAQRRLKWLVQKYYKMCVRRFFRQKSILE